MTRAVAPAGSGITDLSCGGDRLVHGRVAGDRWRHPGPRGGDVRLHPVGEPPLEEFTTQNLDIFVAPGDIGLWLGALRDPDADIFPAVSGAVKAGDTLLLYLLYGDFEGGQRVITQFSLRHLTERWLTQTTRHFNVDRPDPR